MIGRIYEVQFMRDFRSFEQISKPAALRFCVARKVEDDGDAFGEYKANVWRQRVSDSG